MLFSSVTFLYYFLPAVILLYFGVLFVSGSTRLCCAVLLLASLFFYAWGEKTLVLLFAFSILLGYFAGILIEKTRGSGRDKVVLLTAVVVDLGLLGYYKYADFFISGFNRVFGMSLPLLRIVLPIGISFYTFQLISYAVDVYRSDVPAQRDLLLFATYVSMFPQLIAGPIVRYADVEHQLSVRTHSLSSAATGIRRFLLGLGKKVLFANVLGEVCAAFQRTAEPSVLFYWMHAVFFSLQIYFDFSGYSDMAIGLGKLFGFDFPENFDYPYTSRSITEFWRRWHISLGSWFRDYVYIPLGGSRCGKLRHIRNILVVWALTGLWHGAAWSYVLWGLYFALLLIAEKLWLKKRLDAHPVLGHLYVIFAVLIGFSFFDSDTPAQAIRFAAGMFGAGDLPLVSAEAVYLLRSYAVVLAAAMIGSTPLPKRLFSRLGRRVPDALEPVLLTGILLISTAYLVDGSFNPFLYFRF